jgi:single-stranded-DNA-specific exonuclease
MVTWLEPEVIEVPGELQAAVGGHPLVAQTLARRGYRDLSAARGFLEPAAYTPTPAAALPGMQAAVERLLIAIQKGERICVWGDFDVDGQTSTALLVASLRRLGARVDYHIPLRAGESHGVNLPVLSQILDGGAQLVLTCDTGISAHAAADLARQRGVDLIITDHHDLPPDLPQALAVVNPKLLPEGHPLGTLPGVGVAYKLAEALYEQSGIIPEAENLLDLVALGVVVDVALQVGDARYLLQRGLQVLRRNRRLGLRVMLELAEINPDWLSEEHIGFVLGPQLNAIGRLGDANPMVEFLTTDDLSRARILALELQGLNARRKLLTDQVFQGAMSQIQSEPGLLELDALVLAHPAWPAGVVGIVASRLVERFHKPVVLIASPADQVGRGSARSVEGVNITQAIAENQGMLQNFGGHPMAAGLSIDPQHIPEFRRGLARAVHKQIGDQRREPTLQIDGYLALTEMTLDLVADLDRLAPFGAGNPPLVMVSRSLHLQSQAALGRDGEHLALSVEDADGNSRRVIWWQGAGWPLPQGRFDLAFTARASTYGGQRDVQIEWVDFRQIEEPALLVGSSPPAALEILDFRQETHPLPVLQRLLAEAQWQVWCEAGAKEHLDGRSRSQLQPAECLAIWTAPPGPAELKLALSRAAPRRVALFNVDPHMDEPRLFLSRLAGLVKYALNAGQAPASLEALAAATAQRVALVSLGLAWLEAQGIVRIEPRQDGEVKLLPGSGEKSPAATTLLERLQALLAETAAYRRYYARAVAGLLLAADGDLA